MAPKISCPNCGLKEWLENPELHYMPRVEEIDENRYAADTTNGIHVKIWRCNNCMYLMHFWEPD